MIHSYVETLCRSNFSFLRGASHPQELVGRARELGLAGLALADRDGMYGIVRGLQATQKQESFCYLVGAEVSFQDHGEVVMLAMSRRGYGDICQLLTKGLAREKGVSHLRFADLSKFSEKNPEVLIFPRNPLVADMAALYEMFAGRIYLPLVRYLDGLDRERTQKIREISKRFQLSVIASNDVYYHLKERKNLQDVLISIREGVPIRKAGYKLFSNGERYLKSPEEMRRLFGDFPEALKNTFAVSERCHFSLRELRYFYPSEWIPQGYSAQSYLEKLVWERLNKMSQKSPAMEKQLRHELHLVEKLHFADYFLTVVDLVDFAREQKILCQGRGAAANSALCYVLGITAIDPVRSDLLFERFLSAERGEPPDIDVDFEHERREEVIQYIYKKYGRDRAAMVSAVITYRYRSALREVCKAFDLPVGTLSAKNVEKNFQTLLDQAEGQDLREKIEILSGELAGFPRHISIHSGGFTLSAEAITTIVPVEMARKEGRTIIQWDKYDLDELGLLKVDVLALGMLSALRKTLEQVGLKLIDIPPEDPATYRMIQRGDTVGTFQIESRAQISMLGRLQPKNFYDLVIEVALVRPGPIVGEMVHPYLKRRRGLEKITFPNEKVRRILGRTLGIPLFQEQVMRLAIELADFTPGEADQLRRAIGAWRSSGSIQQISNRLKDGLLRNGMSLEFTEKIFQQIRGFSEYGFPESHAASFALLAYASCYLKCHYPTEFICSLLNSQPMGFYRIDTLVYDAIRHGVKVHPVSFNESQWDHFIDEHKYLRLGFRIVHGLHQNQADEIIKERQRYGFYKDFADVLIRTSLHKDVLQRMIMAGQFNTMTQVEKNGEQNFSPRQVLWMLLEYANLIEGKNSVDKEVDSVDKQGKMPVQLSLFNNYYKGGVQFSPAEDVAILNPESEFAVIQRDYSAYKLSTHGHPLQAIRRLSLPIRRSHISSVELKRRAPQSRVRIAGMLIVRQRPPTANGTSFATLEDEFGFVDLIIPVKVSERYRQILNHECFVSVSGVLQRDLQTQSVVVKHMASLLASEKSLIGC